MPLPAGVTTFTLTGVELDLTGAPANVGVRGTLTPVDATGKPITIVHLASGQEILPQEVNVTVGADGTWSIPTVPFTDQAGLSVTGWQLRMRWNVPAWRASPGDKTFSVPSGTTSPVLYSSLGPASTVPTVLVPLTTAPLPTVGSYTYNSDGTVASDPDGNTYTWNTDGTPATQTKGGVTRTFHWNTDGTLASVS